MQERKLSVQEMLAQQFAGDALYILMNTSGVTPEAIAIAAQNLVREQSNQIEAEIQKVQGPDYIPPATHQ